MLEAKGHWGLSQSRDPWWTCLGLPGVGSGSEGQVGVVLSVLSTAPPAPHRTHPAEAVGRAAAHGSQGGSCRQDRPLLISHDGSLWPSQEELLGPAFFLPSPGLRCLGLSVPVHAHGPAMGEAPGPSPSRAC